MESTQEATPESTHEAAPVGAGFAVTNGEGTVCTACVLTTRRVAVFDHNGDASIGASCDACGGVLQILAEVANAISGDGVNTTGVGTGCTEGRRSIVSVGSIMRSVGHGSRFAIVTLEPHGGNGDGLSGALANGTGVVTGCTASRRCTGTGRCTRTIKEIGERSATNGLRFVADGSESVTATMVAPSGVGDAIVGNGASISGEATGCTD